MNKQVYSLLGDTYVDDKYVTTTVVACADERSELEELVERMAAQHNTKPYWTDFGLCYGYDNLKFVCNFDVIDYIQTT